MAETLDARGIACPGPVLMVKDAIENQKLDIVEVLVDNEAAKENVTRFLGSRNFTVSTSQEGGDFKIFAAGDGESQQTVQEEKRKSILQPHSDQNQKILVLISTDRIGFGDDELGKKLMISFIKTIKEMGNELWRMVFVNNGVKLAVEGSPVINELIDYEKNGVTVLVCGTCLSHFNLIHAKEVGETTNMLDIVTAMQLADKVVSV